MSVAKDRPPLAALFILLYIFVILGMHSMHSIQAGARKHLLNLSMEIKVNVLRSWSIKISTHTIYLALYKPFHHLTMYYEEI